MTELALALSSLLCCEVSQDRLDDIKAMDSDLDTAPEDDSLADVGAFLLLLSQIQLPQNQDQNRDSLNITEADEVKEHTSSSLEAASWWEDNIAVTWINSEYYEKDTLNLLPVQDAAVDIAQQLIEQPASSNTIESEQIIKDSMPLNTRSVEATTTQADTQIFNAASEGAQVVSDQRVSTEITQVTPFELEKDKLVDFLIQKNAGLPLVNGSFTPTSLELQEDSDFAKPKNQSDSVLISASATENFANTDSSEQIYPEMSLSDTRMSAVDFQDSVLPPTSIMTAAQMTPNPEKMSAAMPALTIPVPVEHPQWSQQFAEHTLWLGQTGQQSALLKLHPEELGPLQIHVQVTEGRAAVHIISPTSELRELIDQSVLRLQELMAEQGLTLVEVNVQAEDGRSQQRFIEPVFSTVDSDEPEILESNASVSNKSRGSQHLIDYFA